ncbi:helix-turn-helix transcriptional regulator [Ruegeria arenilitoris]|uniref:helix-turn-helix transcriptional regulator n=1 Tax=Ruegeria arenilitoris TaxID=1173585 RepID=UPI001C2C1A51|nr:helix-turn-helix domain-containing protein [Ruegeria arenilitoris]
MSNAQKPQLLDTAQAAHHIGYSTSTLEWWRTTVPMRGPKFVRMGRRIRYRLEDLNAFIESGIVDPAAVR